MKHSARILAAAFSAAILMSSLFGCAEKTDFGDEVYKNKRYAGESVFFTVSSRMLSSGYMSKADSSYPACIDPLCDHSTASCAARTENPITATLTVLPEGRRLPLVYICFPRPEWETVDGERVSLPEYEQHMSIVRQFDAETGQAKDFAPVELTNIRSAILYHGILYLSADGFFGSGMRGRVGALDVATGECVYLEEDGGASVIGIENGRVYFMTWLGKVKSCAPDFSDVREEFDCGTGASVEAYVDGGMLYFARSREDVPSGDSTESVCGVCAVKLGDTGAGAELVVSGVGHFMPYEGDLYYTLFEYREYGTVSVPEFGELTVASYDNGTLYRYDAESGESGELFSDIGVSVWEIYDIDDGVMLFAGERYRDCVDGKSTFIRNCICDIKTGEWRELFSEEEGGA